MLAPHPCPDRSRGYAIALVSALVFSTTAIFIRHLTGRYGTATSGGVAKAKFEAEGVKKLPVPKGK